LWIYLLKKKSDVFQIFRNFQQLVECQFDKKILVVQSDWGGEYEKLNPSLNKLALSIMCLALMHTNKMVQLNASTATL
jgi:hypothetical protein